MNHEHSAHAPNTISLPDAMLNAEDLPWEAHPAYPGVHMKHLVLGADTGGGVSCHLVRVAPDCALEEHDHPGRTELHSVLRGSGACTVCGRRLDYTPGTIAVIPDSGRHSVRAGAEGLLLLAQFCPALK